MTEAEFEGILDKAAEQLGNEVRASAQYRGPDEFDWLSFELDRVLTKHRIRAERARQMDRKIAAARERNNEMRVREIMKQRGLRACLYNPETGEIHMLPEEAAKRKEIPLATGVLDYFPDALAAVAECSKKGNDQHNPGKPLHWDRSKSGDEGDALIRHFVERGKIDSDGVRHSAKAAWRALALLQKEIEAASKFTPGEKFDPWVAPPYEFADWWNFPGKYSAEKDDGWLPHYGGPCPVYREKLVDVRFHCGEENHNSLADIWTWRHMGSLGDIIAWRPHRAE